MLATAVRAVVPGLAQIHLGRPGRGVAYFALFALALNAGLLFLLLGEDPVLRNALLSIAVLLWMISLVDGLALAGEPGTPDA